MSNAVCTTCFYLTALNKRSPQRCHCEPSVSLENRDLDCPSGFHLCYVCGRTEVGGHSRWSWEACNCCKAVNSSIQKNLGFSLMLGRHSIMNGVSIPFSTKKSDLDLAVLEMINFAQGSVALSDWGTLKARELFESNPEWAQKKVVPLSEWQKRFKANRKTSLDAFESYYGIKNLASLLKKEPGKS